MTTSYLLVGFDWNAAEIGTTAHQKDSDMEVSNYRPLQFASVDSDGNLANYRYAAGEFLRLRLFNLTRDQDLNLNPSSLWAALTVTDTGMDSGQVLQPELPSRQSPWTDFSQSSSTSNSPAFGFADEDYQSWTSTTNYEFQSLDQNTAVELSAVLDVLGPNDQGGTETRKFIGDPEMWIQGGG